MGSYMLVTRRMYMTLSSPKLAKEVRDFNLRNKEALEDTEPARPNMYYTKRGCRQMLKLDYKDTMNGTEFRYYLTLKGEKKIIGTVCIGSVMFGSVKSGTISYKMDKDYQGMGLCSEAVEELINFCFNVLQLHRIDSYVMPRNAKSLRIMEKFGFEKEGLCKKCLEVNNKWEDHYIFGLINDKISPVARYDY